MRAGIATEIQEQIETARRILNTPIKLRLPDIRSKEREMLDRIIEAQSYQKKK